MTKWKQERGLYLAKDKNISSNSKELDQDKTTTQDCLRYIQFKDKIIAAMSQMCEPYAWNQAGPAQAWVARGTSPIWAL